MKGSRKLHRVCQRSITTKWCMILNIIVLHKIFDSDILSVKKLVPPSCFLGIWIWNALILLFLTKERKCAPEFLCNDQHIQFFASLYVSHVLQMWKYEMVCIWKYENLPKLGASVRITYMCTRLLSFLHDLTKIILLAHYLSFCTIFIIAIQYEITMIWQKNPSYWRIISLCIK